jgi:hypothetical protein
MTIIEKVKQLIVNEPLASAHTYYPLFAEGETGWRLTVLAPKTKSRVLYVLAEAALYGLQGNTVLYRVSNGDVQKLHDSRWSWSKAEGYVIYHRGHRIPCEVKYREVDRTWQRSTR